MNTNDLMIFLVAIAALSGTLMIFAHHAFRAIRRLETAAMRPVRRGQVRGDYPQIAKRKRAASFPGIICALPMHQVKRAEAPMNDIWSR
jgi:hypothetical protein